MSSNPHTERLADRPTAAAVAVALASVAALDPGGWFPFSIAKWPAVLVCALIAGGALAWADRPAIGRPAALAWLVLLAVVVLSAATGLEERMAWFGTPVRHLGALTWAAFAMLFVVGTHVGSKQVLLRTLTRGMVAVGGVLGGYTTWEMLVGAPVSYVTDSSRSGGPYGSAAYLGAACCLFLPIAIGLAASAAEDRRWRVGAAVVAALLVGATIGSGTRGALVALVFTAAVVAAARFRPSLQRRHLAVGLGAITATATVVAVILTTERFRRSTPIGSRFDEWRLGATALGDRPLLGFGPEGYRLVVDRFLSADYVRSYGDAVLPDRAHNAVLDVALSSGVVAALAYVALLVVVVIAASRLIRSGTAALVGIGGASIAFVVQQQFLFPIAEVDAVFWIVAGATVAAARGVGYPARTVERGNPAAGGVPCSPKVRVPVAVVLAVLAVGVTVGGVRSVAADRLILAATESDDVEQSISDAEHAIDLDAHDIRHRIILARSSERRQTLSGVDAAIDAVEQARAISPLDPTVRREQARLASLRASITGAVPDRDRATVLWRGIVEDAPNCASCQRSLALTSLEAGDADAAVAALERAARLGDDVATTVLDSITAD